MPLIRQLILPSLMAMSLGACATVGPDVDAPQIAAQELESIDETQVLPRFVWPVDGGEVTDSFGKKRRKGRIHKGLDIAHRRNTPIYAAEAGKVTWRGRGRGYGHYVEIKHKNGWTTRYAHLNKYKVNWSQEVKKGDLIGLMGRTGRASGTHLHFEVRKDQVPINPLSILPRLQMKVADNYTGIPTSPDRPLVSTRETFRAAYLNGPVFWLF